MNKGDGRRGKEEGEKGKRLEWGSMMGKKKNCTRRNDIA